MIYLVRKLTMGVSPPHVIELEMPLTIRALRYAGHSGTDRSYPPYSLKHTLKVVGPLGSQRLFLIVPPVKMAVQTSKSNSLTQVKINQLENSYYILSSTSPYFDYCENFFIFHYG